MSKEIIKIILKVIAYAITLILGYLGVNAMVSCTVHHALDAQGRTIIVTNDTTVINHDGSLKYPR